MQKQKKGTRKVRIVTNKTLTKDEARKALEALRSVMENYATAPWQDHYHELARLDEWLCFKSKYEHAKQMRIKGTW